jgi:quercetin dioxygenase-like cupin family protein
MSDAYVYVRDLRQQAKVPENGILTQTLRNDDRTKVLLFGFAPGQELSAHTAPEEASMEQLALKFCHSASLMWHYMHEGIALPAGSTQHRLNDDGLICSITPVAPVRLDCRLGTSGAATKIG